MDKTSMEISSLSNESTNGSETCASKMNEAMEQEVHTGHAPGGDSPQHKGDSPYEIPEEEDPGDDVSNAQIPGSVQYNNSMPASSDIDADCDNSYSEGEKEETPTQVATEGNPADHEFLDPILRQQRQWKRLCERRNANLTYTMEEVAKHNTVHDCWLVAHGKVYDVTPMLFEHPAGVRSILRHAGGDSTTDFDFHSNGARKMWKQYEIGKLEGCQSSCLIM
eukprot:gb/GECG01000531.1/.p1 GENE.gb/GECG01000531.1/~~gb/GECG01000531.1/.p1  ORF type:complete len:222 (+),score=31.21 gb/GECG01000531.1/:1-666(+)